MRGAFKLGFRESVTRRSGSNLLAFDFPDEKTRSKRPQVIGGSGELDRMRGLRVLLVKAL